MPPLAALEELAELAASYSAAHERSRASQLSKTAAREADAALILSAIDLASVAIDAVAELAAVAQHPQLSAALSKAAIVSVAVLSERELASAQSGAPVDASGALSDIKTLAQIVTDAVREEYPSPPVAAPPSN